MRALINYSLFNKTSIFSQPTTAAPVPAAPPAKPEAPQPAAKQTQDKAKSALDQAMAATLAAIDVPTPPSKLGILLN